MEVGKDLGIFAQDIGEEHVALLIERAIDLYCQMEQADQKGN